MRKNPVETGYIEAVAAFAAATLEAADRPSGADCHLPEPLTVPITYTEWLHARVLARAGIPELPSISPLTPQRIPLFSHALGCGGHWDW